MEGFRFGQSSASMTVERGLSSSRMTESAIDARRLAVVTFLRHRLQIIPRIHECVVAKVRSLVIDDGRGSIAATFTE
jgi:hypothetical protein